MTPVLKILFDVASFRLRRLEMANMAGALAIALACHLGLAEIAYRLSFAFLLNLLVYLNNDWHDLDDDLAAATREQDKTRYLAEHRGAAVVAQLAVLALLLAMAVAWGGGLLIALLAGGGVCWAYSAKLKRLPFVDVLAMVAWGVAMPAVGLAPGHPEGLLLLGQLGLFSGVFESIQVLRDREIDATAGVRTTAVVLGPTRARALIRVMLALAGLYAGLCFAWWLAPFIWAAALQRVAPGDDVEGYWNRTRMILGVVMLIETLLVWLGWAGSMIGSIGSIGALA
ncbi:UbiA family prenyltransferase [Pseudenhygromyxa sp. WMMC2535]|uniref:UbiA family prenyltransferase n=1 Tax=Pseudenhygromyxa sp. WMMC2535 TaxID=2712867 RepID=UPI00155462F5|nr:UbiA family prenyltransferase [Pseudenhygromyxa sp. WMMC2535]NVB42379.1 UbiA family prenyltransferase [Pseudenhygromyxa sp. WMMC2535]